MHNWHIQYDSVFFQDKLFGYVKDNLKEYLSSRFENEELQEDIEALREQVSLL